MVPGAPDGLCACHFAAGCRATLRILSAPCERQAGWPVKANRADSGNGFFSPARSINRNGLSATMALTLMPPRVHPNSKGVSLRASDKAPTGPEPPPEKQPPDVMVPAKAAETSRPERRAHMIELRILTGAVVLLALHALYVFSVGFGHNISDRMGSRQAQTALPVRSLLEGSPWFAYQTPLFGPPWGLPIEFPLYQWVTALLVAITGMPLMAAGRIVSIGFFFVCVVALWKILEFFHTELRGRLVIVALLLVCPIYLFWSRTFMIETCALSVCLWFTLFALRAASGLRRKDLAIATALGVFAAVVKITTFAPFWVVVAGWLAVLFWKRLVGVKRSALLAALLLAVPLLAETAWARFADSVVARNELAASFLLSSNLHTWVFGRLADRFLPDLWDAVSTRMFPEILGMTALFFCILVLLPLAQRYSRYAALCVVLFFVDILAFPGLHKIHPYYQTANAIFLTAAAGFVICGLMRGGESHRIGGYALFVVLIWSCLYRYYDSYFPAQQKEDTALTLTGQEVQRHAKPDQFIIVRGDDWGAEIPFYSHRRAIMDRYFSKEQIQRRIRAAAPATVGDVLYCRDARKELDGLDLYGRIERIQRDYGLEVTSTSDDGLCEHWFSGADSMNASGANSSLPCIGTIDMPGDNETVRGKVLVAGWALSGLRIKVIEIAIDGQNVASAGLATIRPDLVAAYPQYPGHPFNGYNAPVDPARLKPGRHTVSASAVLQDGSSHPIGKRTFIIP